MILLKQNLDITLIKKIIYHIFQFIFKFSLFSLISLILSFRFLKQTTIFIISSIYIYSRSIKFSQKQTKVNVCSRINLYVEISCS